MENPILFSTPMVKAILEGRKTQTRRVVKWKPYHEGEKINFNFSGMSLGQYMTGVPESGYVLYSRGHGGTWNQKTKPIHCPYGEPGDILWVRETWAPARGVVAPGYLYKSIDNLNDVKWKPSIHMPRKAARIFLKVKDVRVERLQDITGEDAQAEGVKPSIFPYQPLKPMFEKLWNDINAKRGYGWDANPWVWVIEFERVAV